MMDHNTSAVPLPHSGQAPYSEDQWNETKINLTDALSGDLTFDKLEEMIVKEWKRHGKEYCTRFINFSLQGDSFDGTSVKLGGLHEVFSEMNPDEAGKVLKTTIPAVAKFALQLPELFPSGTLKTFPENMSSCVVLTRHQVAVLLANMFFCTCRRTEFNKYDVHFGGWCTHIFTACVAYLRCLFDYFDYILNCSDEVLKERLVFMRRFLSDDEVPSWEESQGSMCRVTCETELRIGDTEGLVQVDFANKDIGFGETGTQEELLFGMSPEMCPVVLFNRTLSEKETVLIIGATQIGSYSGYGMDVEYKGRFLEAWDWCARSVVAMDAIPYFPTTTFVEQLEETSFYRELNKAYCAFRPLSIFEQGLLEVCEVSIPDMNVIGTGNWGCGAFCGDKEVKVLVQVLAASEANKSLVYHSFGAQEFSLKVEKLVSFLRENNITVGRLVSQLKRLKSTAKPSSTLFESLDSIYSREGGGVCDGCVIA